MKHKFKLLIIIATLAILPVFYGQVTAEENTETNTTESTEAEGSDEDESTDEDKAAKLKERVQERKDKVKAKLTEAKKNAIKSKCKSAQGLLTSAKARINGVETSRSKIYDNLVNRLTELSKLLGEKGLDVSELDSQIETLKTMITDIKTDIENYKQAVADAADMTCTDDPEAFRVSLDDAKEERKAIYDSSTKIRAYLKETIKATLKSLRTELENQQTNATENTSTGEDTNDINDSEGGQ